MTTNHRCQYCNSLIIFDQYNKKANGEYTPLDLNHKRHFCSSVDKIIHECRTVDYAKKIVDDMNNTDLSSFGLELRIVDIAKK